MGKKIPGKKHRTVKDPHKQRAKRNESLKGKVNNPPKKLDHQEVPKSLLRIMELKEKTKQGLFKAKRKKKKSKLLSVERALETDEKQPGMKRAEKFIPKLQQGTRESVPHFAKRVHFMVQSMVKESQFEEQFGVEIKKDLETGQVLEVKKQKNDESQKRSKKKKLSEKRKEKKKQKLEEKNEPFKDFSNFKDEVKFGECVHRPPVNLPKLKVKKIVLSKALEKERTEIRRQKVVDEYRKTKKVSGSTLS